MILVAKRDNSSPLPRPLVNGPIPRSTSLWSLDVGFCPMKLMPCSICVQLSYTQGTDTAFALDLTTHVSLELLVSTLQTWKLKLPRRF
jgi:hypothetical protein